MESEASAASVVVTGATGSIGRPFTAALVAAGHQVTVLTRDTAGAERRVPGCARYLVWRGGWAPDTLSAALDGVDAVVHLAGPPLFAGRHSRRGVERLTAERIASTAALAQAMGQAAAPPVVWLNASSQGFYGFEPDSRFQISTEADPAGADAWGVGNAQWELAAVPAARAGVRVVHLRTGVFLPYEGGPVAAQWGQFRRGFGTWIGSRRAAFNWIHQADAVGLMRWALHDDRVQGPLNVVAPNPTTSRGFAEALGQLAGYPPRFGIPEAAIRVAVGPLADILTRSHPVLPAKALELGYRFGHPDLGLALADLVANRPQSTVT